MAAQQTRQGRRRTCARRIRARSGISFARMRTIRTSPTVSQSPSRIGDASAWRFSCRSAVASRMPPESGRLPKMADLPRLNNVIRALEAGQHALTCFAPAARRFGDRDERLEIRRLRVRDGAQSVGRRPAARLPAIHAQPRADRQGRPGAAGDADGPHPGQRRRDGAMARQAGARHRLLRHRVPAHLDGGGGRQRGRRLPLSAPEERAASTSRPASAATARPPRRATGASASRSTTRRPTSGRSTRRARSSASCRSRTPAGSRTSTPC